MNNWIIPSLLSVLVLSGSEFFQKISLSQKVTLSAITNNFFVWTLQGVGGLVLAVIFGQLTFEMSLSKFLCLLVVSIIYFAGGTFYYTSFKGNSPSISMVLVSISVVVSTVLGILFFKEGVYLLKFTGIIFILSAIALLNLNNTSKINKFNIFALLGGICYGFAYSLDKYLALQIPPLMYLSILCFSIAVTSLVIGRKTIMSEVSHLKIRNYIPLIIVSVFGTLFNAFTFISYTQGGQVGIVDAINNSAVFIVIIMEVLVLKDISNLPKKLLCATTAFLGVLLLVSR